ncbi:uncharacterized protein [Elaeis guineensis]|uniref:uncharacterized protein isoform X3 n=1 Tax=Elaeis guineensis var. tenera TaxID=51953 RepID=UPI003C6D4A71
MYPYRFSLEDQASILQFLGPDYVNVRGSIFERISTTGTDANGLHFNCSSTQLSCIWLPVASGEKVRGTRDLISSFR